MRRLRREQTQSVLNALDVLYSDVEPSTLPLRIAGAINAALSSETVMVDSFGAANEMKSLAQYPAGLMSPQEYALLAHNLPHHPLFAKVILTRETTPFRMRDAVVEAEFRKTPLYNEMIRPMSITDQIVVGIRGSQDHFITCCLSRTGGAYTESERRMVSLINPHFASAVRSAQSLLSMRSIEGYLQSALHTTLRGLIVLTRGGEVKYATDPAVASMQKYFGRGAFGAKRLPRKVELWLRGAEEARRGGDYRPPPAPFRAHGADGELRISLTRDGATGELLLLVEERSSLSPEKLRPLGLTKREAEILFWVAQGKTDGETGTLCGISPRTVQIHLTHVYAKLGVENRTAATLKAFELLQP